MIVQAVTEIEKIMALRKAWEGLWDRAETGSPYLHPDWVLSWWDHLGGGRSPWTVLVWRGDDLVGLLSLARLRPALRGLGVRRGEFAGAREADALDILIEPGEEGEVARALVDFLSGTPSGGDWIRLRKIPAASRSLMALQGAAGPPAPLRAVVHPYHFYPFLPIRSSWEEFILQPEMRGKRKHITDQLNHLKRLGNVQFQRVDSGALLQTALAEVLHLDARSSKGERGISIFRSESRQRFYAEVARVHVERGTLSLWFLLLSGRPIAMNLGWIDRGILRGYYTAFDRGLAAYSPGALLMAHVVRDCFERGLKGIDFSDGEEGFKHEWTNEARPHVDLHLLRSTSPYYLPLRLYLVARARARRSAYLVSLRKRLGSGWQERLRRNG